MRELFRITHGQVETEGCGTLWDYNLEVYAGDIIYIQGMPSSGLSVLPEMFSGRSLVKNGMISLNEKRCKILDKKCLLQNGIYVITAEKDLVDNLSVAENLEILRGIPNPFKMYNRKELNHTIDNYLKTEGLSITGDTLVSELISWECQNISLLKAKMHGAKLIILDCTIGDYEGKRGEKLCHLIEKLNREGISFVILAERFLPLAEIANRIQMIYLGKDLMEWSGMDAKLHQDLNNPMELITSIKDKHRFSKVLYGMYDYEWEMEQGFLEYLKCFWTEQPLLWEELTGMTTPPLAYGCNRKIVILPRQYLDIIFDELGIKDNIIMTIPKRIASGKYGYIHEKMADILVDEFCIKFNIDKNIDYAGCLGRVQKRLLGLYRWEIIRPRVLFIDNPYFGLVKKEANIIREYLQSLVGKGIKVCYFSQSLEELKEDCERIIYRK